LYTKFRWGNLRETDHLRDPGVDGRIILRWFFRKWDVVVVDSTELVQDRDRWHALVNAVINLRVPQNAGNFLTSSNSFSRTLLHGVCMNPPLLRIIASSVGNNTQIGNKTG
jgi:hypothetical protein